VQPERTHASEDTLSRDMSLTLRRDDRLGAVQALLQVLRQWPGARFEEGPAIVRVSAVGAAIACTAETAARMFRAIADAGINIELFATSEICTSCVVAEADGVTALQAIHAACRARWRHGPSGRGSGGIGLTWPWPSGSALFSTERYAWQLIDFRHAECDHYNPAEFLIHFEPNTQQC
jgi:hypothetical protein